MVLDSMAAFACPLNLAVTLFDRLDSATFCLILSQQLNTISFRRGTNRKISYSVWNAKKDSNKYSNWKLKGEKCSNCVICIPFPIRILRGRSIFQLEYSDVIPCSIRILHMIF